MKKNNKALDHKCPTCGAPLFFNPNIGLWKCEFCDNEYTLDDLKKYNKNKENNIDANNIEFDTYLCKNCGAEIIADTNTAATFCIYCGNTAILKEKLSGKFAPDKIIPFAKDKEYAIKAFKNIHKGRPLMPNFFNKEENIEKIRGIYIPFWLFDTTVNGDLDMNCSNKTVWNHGEYTYVKTDNYKVYRTVSMNYNKVPIDGSTKFDDEMMKAVEPFDYRALVDYNHAYLSGFLAEKYDLDSDVAFRYAINRTVESSRSTIKNSLHRYDTINVTNDTLMAKLNKTEYALLPIYMINVKYKNKMYLFAMNGQTGELVGDVPLDKKKTTIYSLFIFITIFLFVILLSYIFYVIGRQL